MKTYILSAVALAALAGTVFAQQPPAPPHAGAPAPTADVGSPPPPPGGPDRQPGEQVGPSLRGPGEDLAPHGHRPPPPPPPSKAAHFRIEDDETKIDVKCADDEPMKACADIVLNILDRFEQSARQ
jgi:hypothetical protein